MGVRVSRWTLTYFAAALTCFVLAQAAVVLGWAHPARPVSAPSTLAVVHLITIGWLTLLILGALQQFVPVITGHSLAGDRAAGTALVLILGGLAGMVAGFLSLPGGPARIALPLGGAAVTAGVMVAAGHLARGLWRARPLVLPGRFAAAGLSFLLLAVVVGLSMAVLLAWPERAAGLGRPGLAAGLLSTGLALHLAAGIGGWFTLTAMGVAYKLLSIFTLAPEERGATGRWVLRLSAGGLGAVWLAGFLRLAALPAAGAGGTEDALARVLALAGTAGWAAAGAGVLLYLADMVLLYRSRRRPALELNARYAPWALAALGTGVMLLALAAAAGRLAAWAGPIAFLWLFGWLSGLGLTQLYKLVPFLTWLERFGPRLGRGPVVRVQDLVDERRARPWFLLYFAATAAATGAGLAGWPAAWRASVAGTLAATLVIARELWRARHAHDRPRPLPGDPPAPPARPAGGGTGPQRPGAGGQAGAQGPGPAAPVAREGGEGRG